MKVMVIVRPYGHLGGDTLVASEFAAALKTFGVEVDVRPADQIGDAGMFDFCHLYAACAPEWGLKAAVTLRSLGARWTVTPLYYPRDVRLKTFNGSVGDLYPGYKESIGAILSMSTAIAATTMGELFECWKLVPEHPGFVMGRGFTPLEAVSSPIGSYAVTVGRIEPHKNQALTALACQISGLHYRCVGTIANPEYGKQLQAMGVEVLGELPHSDTMQILAGARAHVLASFGEIVSGANCEAAYLGVPMVIGLGHDWEYFGDRAEYCNPTDWTSIQRAITRAIKRPRMPWTDQPRWFDVVHRWLTWAKQQLS